MWNSITGLWKSKVRTAGDEVSICEGKAQANRDVQLTMGDKWGTRQISRSDDIPDSAENEELSSWRFERVNLVNG